MCKTISRKSSDFLLSGGNWLLITSAAVTPSAAQERKLPAAGNEAQLLVAMVCPFVMVRDAAKTGIMDTVSPVVTPLVWLLSCC